MDLNSINVINIVSGARVVTINITPELNVIVKVTTNEIHCLVDLDRLGKLAVGFQVPGFISRVLENHISFGVLVIPETYKDNVRLVDPNFLTQLPPDVTESLDPVEAHGFQPPVPKHFSDLSILLAVLLEDQLSFHPLVFILPPPPVLSSVAI